MARIKTDNHLSRKDVIVTKAAALFREKGFKAAIFSQLGNSDTWVLSPITIKNLFKYYWGKIRGR
jgi:hypothetical protein